MLKRIILFLQFILLISFSYSQCPDGTQVCLTLDGGNLDYDSSTDIAGFQFSHNGCVTGASGGDAAANGFAVSASGSAVIGFSFTGSVIPAGTGTLIALDGDVTQDCLSDFIFADAAGDARCVEAGARDRTPGLADVGRRSRDFARASGEVLRGRADPARGARGAEAGARGRAPEHAFVVQ